MVDINFSISDATFIRLLALKNDNGYDDLTVNEFIEYLLSEVVI